MLVVSVRPAPTRSHGSSRIAWRMRSQAANAACASVSGISARNSSPPLRTTMSEARRTSQSSSAARTSTWSPVLWP